jgi:hypothetical protein
MGHRDNFYVEDGQIVSNAPIGSIFHRSERGYETWADAERQLNRVNNEYLRRHRAHSNGESSGRCGICGMAYMCFCKI